jgi:hypothetical protein
MLSRSLRLPDRIDNLRASLLQFFVKIFDSVDVNGERVEVHIQDACMVKSVDRYHLDENMLDLLVLAEGGDQLLYRFLGALRFGVVL